MNHRYQTYIAILTLLISMTAGCASLLSPKNGPDLQHHQEYTRKCYELGISYMKNSRYELARQQFTFAAANAVSKSLYLQAAEGIRRVDRIIKQNR